MRTPDVNSPRKFYDVLGVVLSVIVIGLALILWLLNEPAEIKVSEVGDYLAGTVSALALIWLVLGYRLQRHELVLQLEELTESTKTQKDQNDALNRQADALFDTAKSLNEVARPYISVDLYWDGRDVEVKVQNDGARAARNVSLDFDPPLSELGEERFKFDTILNHTYLPPRASRVENLAFGLALFDGKDSFELSSYVKVEYQDDKGMVFSDEFRVSLRGHGRNVAKNRAPETSLHEITESLGDPRVGHYDSIRKSLQKIASSLQALEKKSN